MNERTLDRAATAPADAGAVPDEGRPPITPAVEPMKPTVRSGSSCRDLFVARSAFDAWAVHWRERLRAEASNDHDRPLRMNRVNPNRIYSSQPWSAVTTRSISSMMDHPRTGLRYGVNSVSLRFEPQQEGSESAPGRK